MTAKVYCVVCEKSQDGKLVDACIHCGNPNLLSEHSLDRPDTWPQELKDAVIKKDKAKREQRAQEALAAKHAEHPVDADGELDMTHPLNNPLLQTENKIDPDDMESVANPLNPYTGNDAQILLMRQRNREQMGNQTFDEEQEDRDMSQPENNPLIPKQAGSLL